MPGKLDLEGLAERVSLGLIDTVLVCFTDLQGRLIGKRFHAQHFVASGHAETHACDYLLANDIDIEHACEKSCACTTCHVIVREGFGSLAEADETEEDLLDKAWGLEPNSRLSCQARVQEQTLVVEIPKYTINMVSEGSH